MIRMILIVLALLVVGCGAPAESAQPQACTVDSYEQASVESLCPSAQYFVISCIAPVPNPGGPEGECVPANAREPARQWCCK